MPFVIKLAIKKRFLVGGGGRNAHEGFTPNVGGMAIFAGLLLSNQFLLFYFFDTYQDFKISLEFETQIKAFLFVTGGSIIMFVIGLLDDISELSSYFRFFVQLLVAFLVVFIGDLRIDNFHGVFGFYEIPDVFSIVSLIVFNGSFVSFNQFSKTGFEVVQIFVSGLSCLATPSTTTIVFCNINN